VEASAIAAYHAEVGHPVVRLLICDDAKQFKLVTERPGIWRASVLVVDHAERPTAN
jgi:hypothetical protein